MGYMSDDWPSAPPRNVSLTYVSLFSGIGGFDLGFDRAGMTCLAQVEWDKKARAVLDYHWRDTQHFKDVRDVGKHNLPTVDLICGGFPCQDVSVAGRRAGLAGERSGLWFEFLRVITELTPRWVVIENVPGLLSSNSGRDFAVILHGLVERGYGVCWRVLDAQYFGLAQRRKRVFIVAGLTAAGCNPAEVLFEREGGYGDTPPRRETGQGTTPYVIKGAAIGRQPENGPQYGEVSEDGTTYTLNASEVHAVAGAMPAHTFTESGFERWIESGLSATLLAHEAKEFHSVVNGLRWHSAQTFQVTEDVMPTMTVSDSTPLAGLPAGLEHYRYTRFGEYTPDSQSSTLRANAGGMAHDLVYGVRRLTPIECERLQGFPDNWTAVNNQADSARYKQLGNAVAVPVAEWIGRRIMRVSA